ncbi:LysR family transcriptional regulator [Brevundimonas sp. AJA228-03]|uniref:LysR substrate-binding domain-containing protein n=1 Tax=Brevundimonas sp. AJA228-03 TaxID=2752515 RepID=UPI001ADECC7B|nr:LysR substrate-binding domain-containing protein [Brevundimonas sp. AJA228-03]QTN20190.1 LysR family transcriptional regulator [Brevundimonas sp. AJA228-03]
MSTIGQDARHPIRLRALRIFSAIVRLGSVTAAARQNAVSQPAASRLLGQLESDVGFELFHRDRGRLFLTADGLLLHQEVERALDNVERVQSLARDISSFRVGHLRLVAPPSFLEAILPDLITRFLEQYPQVHLSIDSHGVEVAKAMIASRAVDAGFVKLPHNRADLYAETVLESGTACVLHHSHPLAARATIDAADLRGVPLILLGQGQRFRGQVEGALADAGVVPRVKVETHTIASACALAARGVGVAIVNETLATAYVRDGTVLRRFTPGIRHEYAFATSAGTEHNRLAEAFLAVLRASPL